MENNFNFVSGTFYGCEKNNFPKLNPEIATDKLIGQLTQQTLEKACSEINNSHGNLTELNLTEVLEDINSNRIYRYQAKYEKTDKIAELRLYLNSENKYTGITFRQNWYDKYYKINEHPNKK